MEKILIVDDEPKITRIYRSFLELEGYEVLEAHDSHSATNLLITHKDIQLILLDIRMPGADGATFCEVAKQYNPDIRVIITSASSSDDQKRLIPQADDYFNKTEDIRRLLIKVRRVVTEVRVDDEG